jgi:hypothetical protein
MKHLISFTRAAALVALANSAAFAQETNILGLTPVPQTTASGAKVAPAPSGPLIRDVEGKAILSGGMQMASSYAGKITTVRVTTVNAFTGADQRAQALAAARLMQRDLPLSCAKQCKIAAMPEPKLLPDGKVQFDLNVEGFPRVLDRDDMVNMIKGVPLAQKAGTLVNTTASAASAPTSTPAATTATKARAAKTTASNSVQASSTAGALTATGQAAVAQPAPTEANKPTKASQ